MKPGDKIKIVSDLGDYEGKYHYIYRSGAVSIILDDGLGMEINLSEIKSITVMEE